MSDSSFGIPRDRVVVEGSDAASYLQGQLSQDVEGMATGDTAWSLVLEPQGKIDAWMRVVRIGPERFELDLDAGHGPTVVARLDRFLLRTKATVESAGTASAEVTEPVRTAPDEPVVLSEVIGRPAEGVTAVDGWRARWDSLRVELGIPAMGAELTSSTIPEEAGLVDVSVSFTKGCYTGQELVARIDSRGRNVPRRLRRIDVGAGTGASAGDDLLLDGEVIGRVTTAGASRSLAVIGRRAEPGMSVTLRSGGVASIEELPPLR